MEIDYLFGDDPLVTTSQQTFPESSSAWRNNNFNTYLASPRPLKSPRDFVAPVNPSVQQRKSHTPTKRNILHQQFSQLGVPMRPMCAHVQWNFGRPIIHTSRAVMVPLSWIPCRDTPGWDWMGIVSWSAFGGGFKKNNGGSGMVPVFKRNQTSTHLG